MLTPAHPPTHTPNHSYQRHLTGNLVMLACSTDVPARAEQCVALGVFVGTEIYHNTLHPKMRFQARPDNVFCGQDNNYLLAPVHIISCMVPDCRGAPMTWQELMTHHAARVAVTFGSVLEPAADVARHVRPTRLPPELDLLVANVRSPLPEEVWTMSGLSEALAQSLPRGSVSAKEDKPRRTMLEDVNRMCWDVTGDHTTWRLLQNNRGTKCLTYRDVRGRSKHTPKWVLREAARLLCSGISTEHAAQLQAMADDVAE